MELGTYMDIEGHEYVPKQLINNQRFHHTHVIGKTGMGKSTALKNWAIGDMLAGDGLAFFDLHGQDIDDLLSYIPMHRQDDVILFDAGDREYPVAFNPLSEIDTDDCAFAAETVVESFRAIWHYSWGPQLEEYLRYGTRALLDANGSLIGLKYLLTKPQYRDHVISKVRDPIVRDFWKYDFQEMLSQRDQQDKTQSLRNKIGVFLSDPLMRNILGQTKSTINPKKILKSGKILLIKIPQGTLGLEKARIFALLLLSSLHLASLARNDKPIPFHIYLDEAHHFQGATLAELLSGVRKFNVSLTLAHQYLDQMDREVKQALLGTVGTLVAFETGADDTRILLANYGHLLDSNALTLGKGRAQVFNGESYCVKLPEAPGAATCRVNKLINRCRNDNAVKRAVVEQKLNKFIRNLK
ncbi:MAG: hypothetical protein EX270_01610 [Pseudomonadales bacterium]|nr:MAG: hypothetical protein EX270_01610 [Pseudomonadales bacterium]